MLRAVLIVLALALAGCSAADEPVQEAGLDGLEATATTGILRCVVVDNTITPLAEVLIIVDSGQLTRTGQDGACAFDGLDGGPHTVSFAKQGYISSILTFDVKPGEARPDTARVVLEADPATTPYTQAYKQRGHISCSTSLSAACGSDLLSDYAEDSSTQEFPLDDVPLWLAAELVWTSTQQTGDRLIFDIGHTPAGPGNTCCQVRGESPLQHSLPGWTVKRHGIAIDGDLFSRVFASDTNISVAGQCVVSCTGPGIALQQDFEVFVHAFHHWIPEGYRFTVDGDP